ncbi:hypothetical protein IQ247_17560 [Plectonema cf. radiosum LEGE 06105]|uniref:Uncharacterized protein n=1 Tax=Plectonema cf. radiosum LEGE 06105 TaxID=945769 RepID=A0A8J7K3R4_9CYAN|nr:hypothetical protein [Plectonema radiosum]MBE9214452.1 hypothetical protein [Plectonema cf. radiosum LEGE 06105]
MSKTEIARYLGKFGEEYEKIVKCRLYSNLDVIFEWWIPNTQMYHHEETKFEDIAIEIQVELAKNAIQNPNFEQLPTDIKVLLNQKSKLTSNSK